MGQDNSDEERSAPNSTSANNEIAAEIAATGKEFVNVDVNLEELMEHISKLLKLIEEKKATSNLDRYWSWPDIRTLNNLKDILSLKDISSIGKGFLKEITSGPVKDVLKVIGHAHHAAAGLLVVAHALEMYENIAKNKKKCLKLLKEMCYVANLVKIFKESPKGLQNEMEEATALIVEGAIMCCAQLKASTFKRFWKALEWKAEFILITQKLDRMYIKMNVRIGLRVLTATEPGKSRFWKRDPKHAVGIKESITEVLKLLECESDQKAVTVILHGVEGIGKTTLAEAVFSRIEGCKYSKVRLFKDIDSTRDIIEFQKKILKDLMGPEDFLPDIRTHEDGQDALEDMLEKVEAFIYIDNVLKSSELQRLLPKNLANAKKVRFLLTARNIEDLKYACPTPPKIHPMRGIHSHEAGLSILKKEIREGINDSQFNEIIKICGGSPLRLTLVAPFIGRANDKRKTYERVMQYKGKWENGRFDEMRCCFAHYEEDEYMVGVTLAPTISLDQVDQLRTPTSHERRSQPLRESDSEDGSKSKRRKLHDPPGNGEGGGVDE